MLVKIGMMFFVFGFGLSAAQTATSTRFSPLLLRLDQSARIQAGVSFQSTPSGELETSYVHKVWDGFDVGAGVHGGILGGPVASGILGADILLRFIRPVSENIFFGVQTQAGYTYSGIGDVSVAANAGSAFPVTLGLVLGGVIRESTQLYFFPAVDLGKSMNAGDPLWKTGIGLQFTLGTTIALKDDLFWVIETQPTLTNLTGTESAFQTFRVGVTLGLLFDL